MVFPVVIYRYERWTVKKAECWRTVVLEKTLQSPLDSKGIIPVNPKGNQPWIFIGRIDAEVEAPIHWLPDAKSWRLERSWKDLDAGKDWEPEKRTAEDKTASAAQWVRIWANARTQWRAEQTGMGQSTGVAKSRHDTATAQHCLPQ